MLKVVVLAFFSGWSFFTVAQDMRTENLVIVTIDGYRWREVFMGSDENILFRDKFVKDKSVRQNFYTASAKERRERLMPFFWKVIAKEGQLYGNRRAKNRMNCTNGSLYSYAGYSEMFVGFTDKRVKDNLPIENPNYTVLEFINKQPDFKNAVAVFATWGVIPYVFRHEKSGLFINSSNDKITGPTLSDNEKILNRITDDIQNPQGGRYDNFTFQYAFEYLKRQRPRVLFISLDETDAHAHGKRYDEYLKAAHRSDSMISSLWTWLQSDNHYKDKTTLLVTTDHGRGTNANGWSRHALLFRGSAHVWLAVIGPDTPSSGEMKTKARYELNQVASTIAKFLSVPYRNVRPIGDPISSAFKTAGWIELDKRMQPEGGN